MCRNIKTLFNFDPPATDEEVRAASLQFVRKLSGFNAPSKANEAAFQGAIVANLPFQATEPELKALFSKAGSVMSVRIVKDRQTGQPRGIAFVEMSTQWEGRRAASMLNRTDFMGKNLLVKEATEKRGFR